MQDRDVNKKKKLKSILENRNVHVKQIEMAHILFPLFKLYAFSGLTVSLRNKKNNQSNFVCVRE